MQLCDESDLDGGQEPNALYPIPTNMPVETWPRGTGSLMLDQWQRDVNRTGGDRPSIIVMPGAGFVWETWLTRLVGGAWEASNGAKFNLNSNALRPAGWTSADAAGLPMFPSLVRDDECERGVVEHALRLIVKRTRCEYIYPATHYASTIPAASRQYPAMGQRFRLKANFVIPCGASPRRVDAVVVRVLPRVSIAIDAAEVEINFDTAANRRYQLEQTSDHTSANWSPVAAEVIGNGGQMIVREAGGSTNAPRFYCLRELP